MLTITRNLALDDTATGTQTGTVGEPSVATNGSTIFVTGNWYAARSGDNGATWTLLDPFHEFPVDKGMFCCDQLVMYLKGQKLWIWLLQYVQGPSGSNIFRLAVSPTAQPGSWHWWDVAPADLDPAWTDVWFDYPDMGVSAQNLWISFNQYEQHDQWRRAVVVRYPLAELGSAAPITRRHWATTAAGSLKLVNGADNSMWFAATDQPRRALRLFQWPDSGATVTAWTIPVAAWNASDYTSVGPGGAPWLSRADDRMTGGWRAGGRLGFLWTAGRSTGRPHPYVRAVTLDESSLSVVAQPDLWSQNGAWTYPAAAPNGKGTIGLSAFFAGPIHPAHAVGVLDLTTNTWTTKVTATSTDGPAKGKWGDYVVCRPHPTRSTSWVASGFTLQGGNDRRSVEPRVVTFRA